MGHVLTSGLVPKEQRLLLMKTMKRKELGGIWKFEMVRLEPELRKQQTSPRLAVAYGG